MPPNTSGAGYEWLASGDDFFASTLAALQMAQVSICLESYIFSASPVGKKFRDALTQAQQRGVRVRVLIDALASMDLPEDFWEPLRQAGGEARRFNPPALKRLWIRNHRKLIICDERIAFIGGFNIAPEYEGDGITRGWRDLGLRLASPLAGKLTEGFEEMFARAEFRHKRFPRLRRSPANKSFSRAGEQILFSGPGRGRNPVKRALHQDLVRARDVKIMAAYFLPTRQLRRDLMRVARHGGRVQLILAGKSDVRLSQLAGQSLYRRLLRHGVEIFEYQPQILHAKLLLIGGVVYAGSSNLDQRSLHINYELMVRFENPSLAEGARAVFEENLQHSRRIEPETWRKSRTLWQKLEGRFAYWLLTRLDPWIARWQWRALPK